jgi:hypothetical protein
MIELPQWDVPEAILSGGRSGWPAILSSLKSVLETGKPLSAQMELRRRCSRPCRRSALAFGSDMVSAG